PRPDVTTVDGDATVEELRATVGAAGHTRYPVLEEGDAILGFVDVKDAFTADDPHRPAADLARDLYLVPESTSIADLLARFREEKLQVAGVIDEWGAFEGFLTVEDVVEAVVGDIRDTFDSTDTVPVQAGEEGRYTIDGAARLEVVEQDLNVRLEAEDYETVAGVLIDRLGRAPAAGDTVEIEGYRFTVIEVEGTRISRIEAVPIE
ncbi:MAG: transporter associated domain-containing protein, partial [Halodesulfurarchaeum sp.]